MLEFESGRGGYVSEKKLFSWLDMVKAKDYPEEMMERIGALITSRKEDSSALELASLQEDACKACKG
jgi:hypothetical protein